MQVADSTIPGSLTRHVLRLVACDLLREPKRAPFAKGAGQSRCPRRPPSQAIPLLESVIGELEEGTEDHEDAVLQLCSMYAETGTHTDRGVATLDALKVGRATLRAAMQWHCWA